MSDVWPYLAAILPTILVSIFFYFIVKSMLEGDRRERIAQKKFEAEQDAGRPSADDAAGDAGAASAADPGSGRGGEHAADGAEHADGLEEQGPRGPADTTA